MQMYVQLVLRAKYYTSKTAWNWEMNSRLNNFWSVYGFVCLAAVEKLALLQGCFE